MHTLRTFVSVLSSLHGTGGRARPPRPPPPAALDGHWEGAIAIMGTELAIRVDFRTGAQGLAATIDIPQQGAAALPLTSVELPAARGCTSSCRPGPVSPPSRARRPATTIDGTFTQGGASGYVPPPPSGARRAGAPPDARTAVP